MGIEELIEIALATLDHRRVETSAIEPAEIAKEAVGGLTQLVTELVDNAMSFSGAHEVVTITGVFDREDYLISISDNGVGIPESMIDALNDVLSSPGSAATQFTSLGIAMVARLAARNDISVRLIPAVPGTTARITVPGRLLNAEHHVDPDASSHESPSQLGQDFEPGPMVATSEAARRRAEAFMEMVFGPMRGEPVSRRPGGKAPSNGNGHAVAPSPARLGETGVLETRVPGEHFLVEGDEPSTMSGESAIDIRLNLSKYDEGRRAAADGEMEADTPSD